MITPFSLIPLHHGEYVAHTGTVLEITKDPALPASLRAARGLLQAYHQRILAAHAGGDESELSTERRIADGDRDRHYSSLAQLAALYTRHPEADKAAAGKKLDARFRDYGTITEITDQGIDDETFDIDGILRDLEAPEMAAAATLIGADPWIAALRSAEEAVIRLSLDRNTERSNRTQATPENIETLRKKANKEYHKLVGIINAFMITDEGAEPWPGLILKINTLIRDSRQVLAARQGRAAAAKQEAAEADGAAQKGDATH
ncbi:DUF6261 family protein [Flaviaesturariibacter aridisoli]|uniref:Uncharacterized protein n=1 Tax=Flaviaesturariibacter aridisoli TaxID=2545761 RepID=A0A4R4DR84_9BACT|nr:DUF6261 family protein [Flaviaesturariibacter aridisoli]TCZ64715.1 hypothetical protein E0486_18025 [Flaviaesturariibacter aridisoli]